MSNWLSFEQVLGYIASIILLIGYGIKHDKKTKIVLVVSSLIFSAHFFMLGAFTACAVNIVNAMRNASSIFLYKSKLAFIVFTVLYGVGAYVTYGSPVDILPTFASFITCIGMFFLGGIRFRVLVVIAVVMWIVHNVVVGSIGGTIQACILFFVGSVTVYRLMRDKKSQQNIENEVSGAE